MTLDEIIKNSNNLIKERIEYIFNSFMKFFPQVQYKEKKEILGIGEPKNFLLCYFIYSKYNGELLVKFKSEPSGFYILEDVLVIDQCIARTVEVFKSKDFSKYKPQKANNNNIEVKIDGAKTNEELFEILNRRSTMGKILKCENNEKINKLLSLITFDESQFNESSLGRILCLRKKVLEEPSLCFCNNLNKASETCAKDEEKIKHLYKKTIEFLKDVMVREIKKDRDKEIVIRLLGGENCPKIAVVAEAYNLTRQAVSNIFKREAKRLSKRFNLYKENGIFNYILKVDYLSLFSDFPVDAFIYYLYKKKKKHVLRAFCVLIDETFSETEELLNKIKVYIKDTRRKTKVKTGIIYNANETFDIIIDACLEIGKINYVGVVTTAKVLNGRNHKTLLDKGFDTLYCFGKLSALKIEQIIEIINLLITEKFLIKTYGLYPVVKVSFQKNLKEVDDILLLEIEKIIKKR